MNYRDEIRRLPALRESLMWYKRTSVRALRRRADDAASPGIRRMLLRMAEELRRRKLAELRDGYIALRVSEITRGRMSECVQFFPRFTVLRWD